MYSINLFCKGSDHVKKYSKKHNILYFLHFIPQYIVYMGVCLHFFLFLQPPVQPYLFHSHINHNFQKSHKIPQFSSIMSSMKPSKIKHFDHFRDLTKLLLHLKNALKPLTLKHFLELTRKSPSISKIHQAENAVQIPRKSSK